MKMKEKNLFNLILFILLFNGVLCKGRITVGKSKKKNEVVNKNLPTHKKLYIPKKQGSKNWHAVDRPYEPYEVTQSLLSGKKDSFSSFFESSFNIWGPSVTSTTPCPFGTCNGTCCTQEAQEELFVCDNGGKIKESLVCNNIADCEDGSDEKNCAVRPPQITLLPAPRVEIFCGDQNEAKSGELLLFCEFAGSPELQIKWKKYEGHVPMKCQQSSFRGRGTLKCPKFKQADQGAYSCIAQNSQGFSESQPKSVAKCSNSIHCKGFTVIERFSNDIQIENCLECFCSGKSTQCQNLESNLEKKTVPFPNENVEVFFKNNGEISFLPEEDHPAPDALVRASSKEITYCVLYKRDLEEVNLLKSYGRNINVPRFTGKTNFLKKAPDLIIKGTNATLSYKFNTISHLANAVDVRFWPGNWHHFNNSVASRADIMKVLSSIESLFFRTWQELLTNFTSSYGKPRSLESPDKVFTNSVFQRICEYIEGVVENWSKSAKVHIESSQINIFSKSESYIEKCTCPKGYEGLSCEFCAPGFTRKQLGNDFICEEVIKCDPCYTGFNCSQCNTENNCYLYKGKCVKNPCHPQGSVFSTPQDSTGKCFCKENVVGDFCEDCKDGFFDVEENCLECWCSGVTNQCVSSNWYKTVISSVSHGGYNSSDGKNFWLLSKNFNGNRLTSYGGYLNYTMRYISNIPKQTGILSVEILTVDNFTIAYTHPETDFSVFNIEKSWSVRLVEKYWKKSDQSSVTRGEFLTVLTKVKAIYIESPYHLASGKSNLTSVRMSSAEPSTIFDGEIAHSVEQCSCPVGYVGLSCERCDTGYYTSRNGNITKCVKCDCENCDPEYGCSVCPVGEYQENVGELPPVCKKCPCNENEISCHKDVFEQTICICKPGYTGVYCENRPIVGDDSFLDLKISPRKVKEQNVGSIVRFNCSFSCDEKLKLVVKKTYTEKWQLVVDEVEVISEPNGSTSHYIFELPLEEKLESVGCYVYESDEKLLGFVKATIEDLITKVSPVKITNCYSDVLEAKENESVEVICDATGSPTPVVSWFKKTSNGQMEKVENSSGIFTIKPTLNDNGTVYSCMAENALGYKDKCSKVLVVKKKCDFVRISPKKLEIEAGKKISLVCMSTIKTSITWSKLNGSFPFFRTKKHDGNLDIDNATVSDSGIYVCTGISEGETINDTASVIVREKSEPPTVYITDDDKKINVGDNYSVTCIGEGLPLPKIKWSKENEFLPFNAHVRNNTLTITNAKTTDSGLYKCEGISSSGVATSFIRITVTQNKKKPEVGVNSTSVITVVENEEVYVRCFARDGIPKPTLEWWKKVFGGGWIKYQDDALLEFRNISRTSAADYKCVGINSAGEAEAHVKIDVLIKPTAKVSEEKISGSEEENVVISCVATGHPRPSIQWFRRPSNSLFDFDYDLAPGHHRGSSDFSYNTTSRLEGTVLNTLTSEESYITFKLSKDMDETYVVCVAKNEAGSHEASTFLKILKRKEPVEEVIEKVLIGSLFEMTCDSSWDSLEKVNDTLKGDICLTPTGAFIPSVQIQHGGKYIFKAGGEVKKIYTLVVEGFVPKFNRTRISHLVLPVTLKSSKNIHIEVSFKPMAETGVLLQKRNLDVVLKNGKIHLTIYSDKGVVKSVLSKIIQTQKWYHLVVDVNSFIDITVYDESTSIFERKTENSREIASHNFTFEKEDNVFLGRAISEAGMTKHSFEKLFLRKLPSFEGCISRLIINNHEFDIVKEGSYSSNVTLCNECAQETDVCEGKGKCFDAPTQRGFICVCDDKEKNCPAACSQKGCETELNLCSIINPCKREDLHTCLNKVSSLQCSCAYGYLGSTCEKVVENTFCSKGEGYVKLPAYLFNRRSLQDPQVIKMGFRLSKPDGVLLWQGDDSNHQYIVVEKGILKYLHLSQKIELSVIGNSKVPLDKKIKIVITRENNTVTMNAENDKDILFKARSSAEFATDRIRGNIILGNLPNTTRLYNKGFVGFDGCIYYVSINNHTEINLKTTAMEIKNVNKEPPIQDSLETIDYPVKNDDNYEAETDEDLFFGIF